jgi:hypothetical protein
MKGQIHLLLIGAALLATLLVAMMGAREALSRHAAASADTLAAKIDPLVIADTEGGRSASFLILLEGRVNLSSAYGMGDHEARGRHVYEALRAFADKTQRSILTYLDMEGVPYKSYWLANAIEATGDRSLVEAIAARSDVRLIESNRPSITTDHSVLSPQSSVLSTIEWGVQNVNAPQVWAMGYTGQGIVIGSHDTGVRWRHAALRPHYRGWNGSTADHNYNWWDAIHSGGGVCGPSSQEPCDDNGHGSHVTGTAVGDDALGNQIGVAPGAKWTGCRGMDQGSGTPTTFIECFQFFIAPTDLTGQNPNPALRPHIVTTGWTCPPALGCAHNILLQAVQNTEAAGIFVAAAGGGGGPNCATVSDPPAIYEAAFTAGAHSMGDLLASFSPRGPVTVDGSNRLKPNVSAPGVNVRSAYNSSDTGYTILSGTSPAASHVAGVVALLWSARPQLARDIAGTKAVLQLSANPNVTVNAVPPYCGGTPPTQIPNNYFGYGRIDALAAVQFSGQPTRTPTATSQPTMRTPTTTATSPPLATPTSGPTNTPPVLTPTPDACYDYIFNVTSVCATIVPGVNDIGNHCDDCTTDIPLPFDFTLYEGPSFDAVGNGKSSRSQGWPIMRPDSNGKVALVSFDEAGREIPDPNVCLPAPGLSYTILPYWDDLRTDCVGCGIFTETLGVTPNRVFIVEWRTEYAAGGNANFELLVYEGQTQFDLIYGNVSQGGNGATIGVQRSYDGGLGRHTQVECNTGGISAGLRLTFQRIIAPCGTATPTPTGTLPSPTATFVPCQSVTATAPVTATATSTTCPLRFTDVPPESTFYREVLCLACRGILGGYADGTFRPGADITRGQVSKIVSNAAGFSEPVGGQTFEDVPSSNTFYEWIERLTGRGIMGGYSCGGTGEPCSPPLNRPYFRPGANATRGQLSKIVSNAANIQDPAIGQFYEDVPLAHTFYTEIMRLTGRGVMSGYACGGPGEPCVPPENRPYFRPGNNVTRGQASKIVANTFFPGCSTPRR